MKIGLISVDRTFRIYFHGLKLAALRYTMFTSSPRDRYHNKHPYTLIHKIKSTSNYIKQYKIYKKKKNKYVRFAKYIWMVSNFVLSSLCPCRCSMRRCYIVPLSKILLINQTRE